MTIMMMMMMMIMTDPFTTNLVVKGPVAKGSVVKGGHPMMMVMMMMMMIQTFRLEADAALQSFRYPNLLSESLGDRLGDQHLHLYWRLFPQVSFSM